MTDQESVQVEPVSASRWAGRFGWPIFNGKDKLFFMGNYEGFRLRNQRETLYSVPSVAMRNGDFSQVSTA